MSPVLVTLYGDGERLGFAGLGTIITAAITNVIGDVTRVIGGKEDWRTAVMNTFTIPWLGRYLGEKWWPVEQGALPTGPGAGTVVGQKVDVVPLVVTGVPLVGATIFQMMKGS